LPVYDAALDYLQSHKDKCMSQYDKLKSATESPEQRAQMDNWEVDGYVNDPATRTLFRETKGVGHMERPVMRHLAERRWKKEGGLDLIMGRIYQNKVVPDVLPDIPPLLPLSLSVPDGLVEPGLTIDCQSLEQAPVLLHQAFQHPTVPTSSEPSPSALYTLVAVDPDTPESETHGYSERLHYLKTDIPISILSGETGLIQSAEGKELVSWEPLAPPRNTHKHRLVFVLLRQQAPSTLNYSPPREKFSLRSLMATFDFPLNSVVGVNLVRSEWTEESASYIDKVWREYRGAKRAPTFKPVSHETLFAKPLSTYQKRAEGLRERAWNRSFDEFQREQNLLPEEEIVEEENSEK